ncbi:MAG: hypothetical protein K5905_17195 [Roseibium sp.]|uniref:hypothetical protein n=1 Tax=Roseibium sp. TaxID=1936156 RepID=UPI00260997DE|nr:hypothetical protein [Roseibium sp.]MCV0427200.1 hypothetical protein [Roseibium sp.]
MAIFARPPGVAAQDSFTFGADNLGAPIDRPGFGPAGQAGKRDWPELGADGQGDYAVVLGRLTIAKPTEDVAGLWSVYRVTQMVCNSLYRGNKTLAEVAPKGFVIARGDIHALGFGGKNWGENWYAITKTGDSEADAAEGHPAWEIKYDDDGNLSSCSVTIGPGPARDKSATNDADRAQAIQYMYIGVPQQFSAIITEPHFAGVYPLSANELITMAVPCGDAWCRISTLYDFRPGKWHFSSTIRFNLPAKAE